MAWPLNETIIAHIDMNSYFASVEQQANPFLRGKPIAVCGKGSTQRTVVSAASKEAKKFGIKSGFPIWEARKLCPELILVPADYLKYENTSGRIVRILQEYSAQVEIFSIDEAFIDLSMVSGGDWQCAQTIMQQIKTRILNEIGEWLTSSVGIAENKLLAKLAGESHKPDGLTVVQPAQRLHFLFSQKLEDLCGIGSATKRRLNALGIYSTSDLYASHLTLLRQEFGKIYGTHLWYMGRGEDSSKVSEQNELPAEKSFSHCYTLPVDLWRRQDALSTLAKLAYKTAERAHEAGMSGRNIGLYLRFNDFTQIAVHRRLSYYTDSPDELYRFSSTILNKINTNKPIRLVGISLSDLVANKQRPLSLWTAPQARPCVEHQIRKINKRYGAFTVYPAVMQQTITRIINIPDGRNKRALSKSYAKYQS